MQTSRKKKTLQLQFLPTCPTIHGEHEYSGGTSGEEGDGADAAELVGTKDNCKAKPAQYPAPAACSPWDPSSGGCPLPLIHTTQSAELESNPENIPGLRAARDRDFILNSQHHARNACVTTSSAQPLIPQRSHQRARSRAEACPSLPSLSPAHGQSLPRQKQPHKSFSRKDVTRTPPFPCSRAELPVDPVEGLFQALQSYH